MRSRGRGAPVLGGWGSACVVGGVALVALGGLHAAPQQGVVPTAGMVITESVRIQPGRYRIAAPGEGAALTIRGDDITVDLSGVTLEGGDPTADPDTYHGVGLFIDGGHRVTVRGATIRGFKVAIRARRSPGLHLTGHDLSYNWKPRLWSVIEHESLVDWMSFHDNEQDEWLRYGAAIYLAECDDAEVDHNRAVQGGNGLMVTRSARVTIWNNTFSWLSAIGLGMYRVTDSRVMHNRLDWDVRGYSHGFYNRGQDSAALLMYEQSSRNIVAYNSATHGGDGLFLWAGQFTMDTGRGGANDNLFYGNDFSHAVANGIEATFSRNQFIANRVEDCWHGVWGGYSYDSLFLRNRFGGSTDGIAIEHGQHITIEGNTFDGDETAIRLWANATQDPNWGYPKTRDTRSRDYLIARNTFVSNKTAVNVLRTDGVRLESNTYSTVTERLTVGEGVLALEPESSLASPPLVVAPVPPMRGVPAATSAMIPDSARRGRATIIVDEWGPYDYRSPKVWPAGTSGDRPLTLRVLGPEGAWTLRSIRGGKVSARSGHVPGELTVVPTGRVTDLDLALEYVGAEVTTPRGEVYPAGARVPFRYRVLEPVSWTAKFWTWEADADPLTAPDRFAARLREAPTKVDVLPRLEFQSSRTLVPGLPNDRIAMRAEGEANLPAGTYEMSVISDDGVRVWIDDRLVIDRWSIHGSELDRVPLSGGRHRLRIDYFEATGWAELQVRFWRR
jgi:nitrous oxidase accessory protein NosD